jgi:hypothetical protein
MTAFKYRPLHHLGRTRPGLRRRRHDHTTFPQAAIGARATTVLVEPGSARRSTTRSGACARCGWTGTSRTPSGAARRNCWPSTGGWPCLASRPWWPGRTATPRPRSRLRRTSSTRSLDNRNRVHIEKITFALDGGITVNPDLVRAQVEGGLIYALGAAARGEIVLGNDGQIITQNFDSYPVMRMESAPQIEVLLIESGEPPTGVGEVSVPTAAPALTNAIAALTGTRIRRLPIAKTTRVY